MRLVYTATNDSDFHYTSRIAKVYKNTEWEEYIVKFFQGGKHLANADYHTGGVGKDYLTDAKQTAEAFCG